MKENITFEQALTELEDITGKLQKGNLPLSEIVKLYARGVEIKSYCEKILSETEQQITYIEDKNNANEDK